MDGGPSRAKQMKEQHIYEEASLVPLSILQQGKKPQNKKLNGSRKPSKTKKITFT